MSSNYQSTYLLISISLSITLIVYLSIHLSIYLCFSPSLWRHYIYSTYVPLYLSSYSSSGVPMSLCPYVCMWHCRSGAGGQGGRGGWGRECGLGRMVNGVASMGEIGWGCVEESFVGWGRNCLAWPEAGALQALINLRKVNLCLYMISRSLSLNYVVLFKRLVNNY